MKNKYLITMISGAKFWYTSIKQPVDLFDYNSIKVVTDKGEVFYLKTSNIESIMRAGTIKDKLTDLIDMPCGTKFYLPPIYGMWEGKTYLKDNELWVETCVEDFKLTKGKYIINKNVRLGKMPHYHMSELSSANY